MIELQLIELTKMLSGMLGKDSEVILSNPDEIVNVENPLDDTHKIGNPLPDNERYFIATGRCKLEQPYVVNYQKRAKARFKIVSSTMFWKNESGEVSYFITVNTVKDPLISMREKLDYMIYGDSKPFFITDSSESAKARENGSESIGESVAETIETVLKEGLQRFNTIPDRLTTAERQSIIRELHKHGVFLVKGAIGEVKAVVYLRSNNLQIY